MLTEIGETSSEWGAVSVSLVPSMSFMAVMSADRVVGSARDRNLMIPDAPLSLFPPCPRWSLFR